MVAQRGQGVESREAATPKTKVRKPSAPKEYARYDAPQRALSFTDQHELKTLPKQIAALEKGIGLLQTKLSDGEFYARDPKGFATVSAKLVEAQATLASAEERWLELEMLREELEQQ
jgi:ATP-binding cassette subfamily F protein uup